MKSRGMINVTLLIIAFAMAIPVYGITTFPTTTEIQQYYKEQTLVLTIMNDGPRTEQVRMVSDPYSAYLMDYVRLEPATFNLSPNSRKNVEISFNFPKEMSPEKHSLVITPVTEHDMGQPSTFYFIIPGEAKHNLKIEGINAEDILTDESLVIDLHLYNRGNVIARAYPEIEILNETGKIDVIKYKSMVMIMPYSRYNLSLRHDFLDPREGNYTVRALMSYNDGKLETEPQITTFSISGKKKEDSASFSWAYLLFGSGSLLIALYIIFKSQSPKNAWNQDRRMAFLRKRITLLEMELEGMVKETEDFINSSNTWLRSRLGEKYEFR